ncbi:MAG: trypsin-like serine protease [Cellvibrionaceae bacterium]|nr:trypsin-like serine protease [Cellvibrionaceae bacterium]
MHHKLQMSVCLTIVLLVICGQLIAEQSSRTTSIPHHLLPDHQLNNSEAITLDEQGLHLNYPKQRQQVNSKLWPWRAIGQVNVAASHYCSGVLIAKDKVLTVAHCLWDAYNKDWYGPSEIHFVAAYARGDYLAYSRIESFQAAGKFNAKGEIDLDSVHTDWAILHLRQDIGLEVGFLDLSREHSVTAGDVISLAGYRRDRPEVLTAQLNCKLLAWNKDGSAFDHSCEIIQGDSGGPILRRRNGEWQVLGIQSLEAKTEVRRWGVAVASRAVKSASR